MPSELQIAEIRFAAGARPGGQPLTVQLGNVTIIVGPNNSGKSRLLHEIERWIGGDDAAFKVASSVTIRPPSNVAAAEAFVRRFETPVPANHTTSPGHIWVSVFSQNVSQRHMHTQIPLQHLLTNYANTANPATRQYLIRFYTARLDGRMRFSLSDPQETGDLQGPPKNHLWALFVNDVARESVRSLTEDVFGLHFVIDATGMQQFRARMSSRKPVNKSEEQAVDAAARAFHGAAPLLTDLGDGVQTFTGLIAAVSSLPHKVLLVDEPEAFLHPPLARRLGASLSKIAASRDASLVTATHSADFVIGCLEVSPNTNVVRLTYENNNATARALSAADLKQLMKDPLVRSTGAIRGMFHRSVIVTEAERDRAFYDELNRRMQEMAPSRGLNDALFVNAQNWQTTHRIAAPLRRLGIPAPVILDIDTISDGTTTDNTWANLYEACAVVGADRARFNSERAAIYTIVQAITREIFKRDGLKCLADGAVTQVHVHLDSLATYGIFVVPVGTVEGWLRHLGATTVKDRWLADIFTRLGDDSSLPGYVRPSNDDVWAFIAKIANWCQNPNRLGIP